MTSLISQFLRPPVNDIYRQQFQVHAPSSTAIANHSNRSPFVDVVNLSPEALGVFTGSSIVGNTASHFAMDIGAIAELDGVVSQPHLSKAQQERVDTLQKELDTIFGVPKTLSTAEQKEEKSLLNQISKITGISHETQTLSAEDERKLEALHKQVDDIFADGNVTKDEAAKLDALFKRIDHVLGVSEQPKALSEADEKKLDELYRKLDKLYGIKAPSEKDLVRAEEIFAELDRIHEAGISGSQQVVFDPLTQLSKEDRSQAAKLITELDGILSTNAVPKILSEADEKKADVINRRIDELYGIKHPTEAQQKEIDAIFTKINKLFEDGKLTADEGKALSMLEKQLDGFFGPPMKMLSESEQKEVEKLFVQLDGLYGIKTLSPSEIARAGEIEKQLAALFEKKISA